MSAIAMRFPGGKSKALTLSYDDGVEQDATLISKMRERGVYGTFNINTGLFSPEGTAFEPGRIHRRMSEKAAVELYSGSGMEVAVHAATHPFLERIPPDAALWEVIADRKRIEELFGVPTHGMAYPFGTYGDAVVEGMRMAGIYYSRGTKSTMNFGLPSDWLRLCPTCHHNFDGLMALADNFVSGSVSDADAPWLFYLWGHAYEFERDSNWDVIDKFFDVVAGRDDVWYATNIDIYNYVKAYEALDFTLDLKVVHNPTACEIFFLYGGRERRIGAGETLKFD